VARLHTAYFGHIDVEQNDVDRPFANIVKRFLRIPREVDCIPASLQGSR
jgi:hypothetical protein